MADDDADVRYAGLLDPVQCVVNHRLPVDGQKRLMADTVLAKARAMSRCQNDSLHASLLCTAARLYSPLEPFAATNRRLTPDGVVYHVMTSKMQFPVFAVATGKKDPLGRSRCNGRFP